MFIQVGYKVMAILTLESDIYCELLHVEGSLKSNEFSIESYGVFFIPKNGDSFIDVENSTIDTRIFKLDDPNHNLNPESSNIYCDLNIN